MNRQILVAVVVLLAVGVGVLGYQLYEEKKQPDGIEIKIGENGVSVEGSSGRQAPPHLAGPPSAVGNGHPTSRFGRCRMRIKP